MSVWCVDKDAALARAEASVRGTLEEWVQSRQGTADFMEVVFAHKVPTHFVAVGRALGLGRLELSPRLARLLAGRDDELQMDLERFAEYLGGWSAAHDVVVRDLHEISKRAVSAPLFVKGGCLRFLRPGYQRFSADVDVFVEMSAVLPFLTALLERGYVPRYRLRISESTGAMLMRLGLARQPCSPDVEICVNYVDCYPRDHDVLGDHGFLDDVRRRATRVSMALPVMIPSATDRLLWYLVEMTANNMLRLRDALDLVVILGEDEGMDWDCLQHEVSELGVEPFWIAAVHWLEQIDLAEHLLPPRVRAFSFARRHHRRGRQLLQGDRPKVLTRSLISQSSFLYRIMSRGSGRIAAIEAVLKAPLRTVVRRVTGLKSADLLERGSGSLLFPRNTDERHLRPWTWRDVESVVNRWSGRRS